MTAERGAAAGRSAVDDGTGTAVAFERSSGFGAEHGVALRGGGVSPAPFASLNLGASVGDAPENVERNRDRYLAALGADPARVCALQQVHGDRIVRARPGWYDERADGAVSDDPTLWLLLSVADCWPLLLHDPGSGAVAAAHCGWRGSVAGLAGKLAARLAAEQGADPARFEALLGPGICGACYQVGPDVIAAVGAALAPGAPEPWRADPTAAGRWRLDLEAFNRAALERAGLRPERIGRLGGCTAHEPERWFSHRRDRGASGRHWVYVRARPRA